MHIQAWEALETGGSQTLAIKTGITVPHPYNL